MKLLIRVDASTRIGSGHVMRCLTVARKLKKKQVKVAFCCRPLQGHLIEFIAKEFPVYELMPAEVNLAETDESKWLGVPQKQDASETLKFIRQGGYDAVLVDHYAIDRTWESEIKREVKLLTVIDDLANRPHDADILIDQTLGRRQADYQAYVSDETTLLCGTAYGLLRDEFLICRENNKTRIPRVSVQRILITFGGADIDNLTEQAIEGLKKSERYLSAQVEVILGTGNPHSSEIKGALDSLKQETQLCVGVADMSMRMMNADVCIGAAGSTSWERCVLGLPAIVTTQATNQQLIAYQLSKAGAAKLVSRSSLVDDIAEALKELDEDSGLLLNMSSKAATLCDGRGAERVSTIMLNGKRKHDETY